MLLWNAGRPHRERGRCAAWLRRRMPWSTGSTRDRRAAYSERRRPWSTGSTRDRCAAWLRRRMPWSSIMTSSMTSSVLRGSAACSVGTPVTGPELVLKGRAQQLAPLVRGMTPVAWALRSRPLPHCARGSSSGGRSRLLKLDGRQAPVTPGCGVPRSFPGRLRRRMPWSTGSPRHRCAAWLRRRRRRMLLWNAGRPHRERLHRLHRQSLHLTQGSVPLHLVGLLLGR